MVDNHGGRSPRKIMDELIFGEYVRSFRTISTLEHIAHSPTRETIEKINSGTVHMKNIFPSLRNIFAKIIIPASLNVVSMLCRCCVNVVSMLCKCCVNVV